MADDLGSALKGPPISTFPLTMQGGAPLSAALAQSWFPTQRSPLMDLQQIRNRRPTYAQPNMFTESVAHAFAPGMIGKRPPMALQRWRDEHPWQNFFSQAIGEAPWFVGSAMLAGPAGAIGQLPKVQKLWSAAKAIDNPFARTFAQEAIYTAPQALTRQALSLLPEEEGTFGRTFGRNVAETVLGGAIPAGYVGAKDFMKHTRFARRYQIESIGAVDEAKDNLMNLRPLLMDLNKTLSFDRNGSFQYLYDEIGKVKGKGVLKPHQEDYAAEALENLEALIMLEKKGLTKGSSKEIGELRQQVMDLRVEKKRAKGKRKKEIQGEIDAANHVLNTKRFKDQQYVGKLLWWDDPAGKKEGKSLQGFINQLFSDNSKRVSGHQMLRGGIGKNNPQEAMEWMGWEQFAPEGWQTITQYPRALRVKDKAHWDDLTSKMSIVEDGPRGRIWAETEVNTGQTVMVAEVPTITGMGGQLSRYAWKTGNPEKFMPGSSAWGTLTKDLYKNVDEWIVPFPQHVGDSTPTINDWMKITARIDPALKTVKDPNDITPMMRWLRKQGGEGLERGVDNFREFSDSLGLMTRRYFAPMRLEFTRNARATAIATVVKEIADSASIKMHLDMMGTPQSGPSPWKLLGLGPVYKGGVADKILQHSQNPTHWDEFTRAWLGEMSPDEARAAGMSTKTRDLLTWLWKRDLRLTDEANASGRAFRGEPKFRSLKNHYGMTRTWVGDWRVALTDEDGIIRGWGSGLSKRAAMADAERIITHVNRGLKEGEKKLRPFDPNNNNNMNQRVFTRGELRDLRQQQALNIKLSRSQRKQLEKLSGAEIDNSVLGPLTDLEHALAGHIRRARQKLNPLDLGRFRERTGAIGFKGQVTPLKVQDVIDTLTAQSRDHYNGIARDFLPARLNAEMAQLKAEDYALWEQMTWRMNAAFGMGGEVIQKLSEWPNKVLRPVFGDNGAEKIIQTINKRLFSWTLASGDVGFPILNGLSPIQTNLPELAFTLRMPPQKWAELYSGIPIPTKDGLRNFSYLDPIKIMRAGVRRLHNPDQATKDFFFRLEKEGLLGPKFVEEVAQHEKATLRRLRGELKGPIDQKWHKTFDEMLKVPAVFSEEFARGWSGMNAYEFGTRMGFEGEDLFLFAKKFIERTNFSYSMADRSRILTGWMGSGWGLFKTWSFNFMGNMVTYGDQALRGNFAPLLWGMAGTTGVAGAVGLPAYGAADTLAKWFTDKGLMEHLYETAGGGDDTLMADTIMYGLPSLLGFTLQGRASVPGSEVGRDIEMLSTGVVFDRGLAVLSMLGSGAESLWNGELPTDNPQVIRSFMKGLTPRTWARAYQAGWPFWQEEGLRSLNTGNRLQMPSSQLQNAAYVLGLPPLEISRRFDAASILYDQRGAQREKLRFWGAAIADAQLAGDHREVQRLSATAMLDHGLSWDALQRSARTRVYNQSEGHLERQYGKDPYTAPLLEALGVDD